MENNNKSADVHAENTQHGCTDWKKACCVDIWTHSPDIDSKAKDVHSQTQSDELNQNRALSQQPHVLDCSQVLGEILVVLGVL